MMRQLVKIALCVMFIALPLGCNDEIWASDYDQSCAQDEDCVVVTQGDYCDRNSCNCPNAAINRDDLEQWEQDRSELHRCESRVACDCALPLVSCHEGTCSISWE